MLLYGNKIPEYFLMNKPNPPDFPSIFVSIATISSKVLERLRVGKRTSFPMEFKRAMILCLRLPSKITVNETKDYKIESLSLSKTFSAS